MPAGAELRAVRAGAPGANVIALRAGACAAQLPERFLGEPVTVIGLCGALRALEVGSVAIYSSVVDDGGSIEFDPASFASVRALLPNAPLVRGYTAPRVVTRVTARVALARSFDADTVDMEGTHVVRALIARGVPFAMVRVVSDDATRDLPPIEDAFDAAGTLQLHRLAVAFIRQPRSAVRFVRDAYCALRALGTLAGAIERASQALAR